ncbi:MAG TPA: hypothetical protein VL988_07060 [Solirubrobacteraceae bacterium]|nr:hypothetical protein [Solirubrobacteraceae bacterium]
MRSQQLEATLTDFLTAAGTQLRAEIDAGAEVPFELGTQRSRRGSSTATLYCYRALTGQFIAEREADLRRLPGHAASIRLLEHFDGLDRYLAGTGVDATRLKGRARPEAALNALLEEVFEEQSDFELRPERLRSALDRLQGSALAKAGELALVAGLHGVAIASEELPLAKGLRILQRDALRELPDAAVPALDDELLENPLIVLYTAEPDDPADGLRAGRAVLEDLLSALRLFGDGRVSLGSLAWARVGSGPWTPLALGTGGRPHGMLVVAAEQEDELRAFCNLVSRRAPHDNDLAWALRRFELACERESPFEGLTDNLLALRALLEPEGPSSSRLAGRLAALCATAEQRAELTERATRAIALERSLIAGTAAKNSASQGLAEDIAKHLRSLLRDVICGHLDPDLAVIADELLEPDELLHVDEDRESEEREVGHEPEPVPVVAAAGTGAEPVPLAATADAPGEVRARRVREEPLLSRLAPGGPEQLVREEDEDFVGAQQLAAELGADELGLADGEPEEQAPGELTDGVHAAHSPAPAPAEQDRPDPLPIDGVVSTLS